MAEMKILADVMVEISTGSQTKRYSIPWIDVNVGEISELITHAKKHIFKTMLSGHVKVLWIQTAIPYYIQSRPPRKTNKETKPHALELKSWEDYLKVPDDYVSPFEYLKE